MRRKASGKRPAPYVRPEHRGAQVKLRSEWQTGRAPPHARRQASLTISLETAATFAVSFYLTFYVELQIFGVTWMGYGMHL